jgi:uncharacterized membrane protein
MKKLLNISLFLILSFLFFSPTLLYAQVDDVKSEIFKGEIIESKKVSCVGMSESDELKCISYEVRLFDEDYDVVESMPTWVSNEEDIFKSGSKVYVSYMEDLDGELIWMVESYSRENYLLILLVVFVLLILVITGKRGLAASFGLLLSFLVLYFFAIPRINSGQNIFLISSFTIFILLFASTFITYGFNIKSFIAFFSSFLGILIITLLGYILIKTLHISGSGEEAAAMLHEGSGGTLRLSTLFLLSIVVGALGVLDDVTVGQASSMMEIYNTDRSLSSKELYRKSMNIGRDHISSMVNTLFIAYAGSSFSLVMLLSANNPDFRILINTGFVVEEIIRTLVASIGLILVVPLTSYISSKIVVKVLK